VKVVALQDESSETDDTGEASAREGHGLASTGRRGRSGGLLGGRDDTTGWGRSGDLGGGLGRGRNLDAGRRSLAAGRGRSGAVSGGDHRLGDGARAVGDGQGGGLGDGVGLGAVDDLGGTRAVGHDLVDGGGGVGHVAVVASGSDADGGDGKGGDGELHLDGIRFLGCVV
jgi:hypothetical protein